MVRSRMNVGTMMRCVRMANASSLWNGRQGERVVRVGFSRGWASAQVYVQPANRSANVAPVVVGLMNLLQARSWTKLGYFRPVVPVVSTLAPDTRAELVAEIFGAQVGDGVDERDARELVGNGQVDVLVDRVVEKYRSFVQKQPGLDAILIEGFGALLPTEFTNHELSAMVANALSARMVLVMDALAVSQNSSSHAYSNALSPRDAATWCAECLAQFRSFDCVPAGLIIKGVARGRQALRELTARIYSNLLGTSTKLMGVIPYDREMETVRLMDLVQQLDGHVLCGEEFLQRKIYQEDVRVVGTNLDSWLNNSDLGAYRDMSEKRAELMHEVRASLGYDMLAVIDTDTIYKVLKRVGISDAPLVERIISRLDMDGDGVVTVRELADFSPRLLPVTAADRVDIVLGTLLADRSVYYQGLLAGIVITGYDKQRSINAHIQGLVRNERFVRLHPLLPVIGVELDTFDTVNALDQRVSPSMTAHSVRNVERAKTLFDEFVSDKAVEEVLYRSLRGMAGDSRQGSFATVRPSSSTHEGADKQELSPKRFQHLFMERAKSAQRRIVLPEGTEPRVVQAAGQLLQHQTARLILLGDRKQVLQIAHDHNLSADVFLGCTIIDPADPAESERLERYAQVLYEKRKKKGMTLDTARELVREDVNMFGTLMVELDEADGMVSGSIHTTASTVRPALWIVKTKPGISIVSSVFFMALPKKILVYGDCAINENPTADQLAQIAVTSAETTRAFGIEPRVAMLSYSTGTSDSHDKVAEATRLVKERAPDLLVTGPIQYDAAVDPDVAHRKHFDDPVAGKANVFIFPDLNTGNNTYKAVQQSTGALAIGPVLQGLNKPINDLSRGATVADIVNTVAITACMAASQ
ncbi:Phosphate acetyltransferase [Porphyridium purpureum]|uniref:Phosphate acetyltransferase n=1 Tax=Porphyridium purpureum TaxID=35688 RepID=A0A5J4YUX1_PORPP|nr:Phosphate acetyltransferase [Porphyridium purpureum]|eukprot:POR1415..scf227_4